jgi:CitB family two-component system response regulator MalR
LSDWRLVLTIKVLIVEDDPMVAEFNKDYLCRVDGFAMVGLAGDGQEVLRVLDRCPVDLILLDIFLPKKLDGLKLLKKIRNTGKRVDVIVVSAARDKVSIESALRLGAVDYLVKPFSFERLQAALLCYKRRMQAMQENALSQGDIDQSILSKTVPLQAAMPKGLNPNTAKKIWAEIAQTQDYFDIRQIADAIGISRISTGKYLEFFRKQGFLELETTYGAVGRPTHIYRRIANPSSLDRYF